jgi:putative intracellular protease/amidase
VESLRFGAAIGMYPQAVLASLGGNVTAAPVYQSHVVIDSYLVTGQNPQSAPQFAAALLQVIAARAAAL